MTYYYDTKDEAIASGGQFEGYWYVDAQLEPDNGWVISLRPRSWDVLKWPLFDILDVAEIDLGRARRRPEGHRQWKPVKKKKKKQGEGRAKMQVIELTGDDMVKPSWV